MQTVTEDIAARRKKIMEEIDKTSKDLVDANTRMRELQKEYRALELDDRRERGKLEAKNAPSGILK